MAKHYSRDYRFETVTVSPDDYLIDVFRKGSSEHLGHLHFSRKEQEPKVLRLEDVRIGEAHEFGKAPSSAVLQGMNLGKKWGRRKGYSHMEWGYEERGNYRKVKIGKKPTSSSARRPR